jgi:hypothetical protein
LPSDSPRAVGGKSDKTLCTKGGGKYPKSQKMSRAVLEKGG